MLHTKTVTLYAAPIHASTSLEFSTAADMNRAAKGSEGQARKRGSERQARCSRGGWGGAGTCCLFEQGMGVSDGIVRGLCVRMVRVEGCNDNMLGV